MSHGAQLEVTRRARTWSPPVAHLNARAQAALGRRPRGAQLGLRGVGAAESRRLNARYRGKDKPTNVLSFPAPALPTVREAGPLPLGDLVICARLLRHEARAH